MNRYHPFRVILLLGALLLLHPLTASAKYLIEFADGQRMTVSNYEETGDTVKVYTSLGSFAFRKNDVVHITDLNPGQKKKPVAEKEQPSSIQAQAKPIVTVTPAPALEEKKPEPKPMHAPGTRSKEMQDFVSQIEDGLFRMRYVFALIIGLKVFKIFFAASVR